MYTLEIVSCRADGREDLVVKKDYLTYERARFSMLYTADRLDAELIPLSHMFAPTIPDTKNIWLSVRASTTTYMTIIHPDGTISL